MGYAVFVLGSSRIKVKFRELENLVGNIKFYMTDPISDMLTRIRNAQMVFKKSVVLRLSKASFALGKILEKEGYLLSTEKKKNKEHGKEELVLKLKYDRDGHGVIREVVRISKPGQRIYSKCDKIPKTCQGLGVTIVSTSQGLMADYEARKRKLGGEIICKVF